jgi:tetratricopeptide (TPR) repeat protein
MRRLLPLLYTLHSAEVFQKGNPKRVVLHVALCGGLMLFCCLPGFAKKEHSGTGQKSHSRQEAPVGESSPSVKDAEPAEEAVVKGVVEYNKGVELFQIAQVQLEKGNRAGQKKLLRQAINRFETAYQQNGKLIQAPSNIGFVYLTLGDYKKAEKFFNTALLVDKNHLNSLNGLATVYVFLQKTEWAIKTLDHLISLDPGNSQYYFNKGSILQSAGKIRDAQGAYEKALDIDPENQRALFNMGTLFENEGALEKAKPYYEQSKSADIGNPIGLEAIHRLDRINSVLQKK